MSPVGGVPEIENVYEPVPPPGVNVWLYAVFTVPGASVPAAGASETAVAVTVILAVAAVDVPPELDAV